MPFIMHHDTTCVGFDGMVMVEYRLGCLHTMVEDLSHRSNDELLAATHGGPIFWMSAELHLELAATTDLCILYDNISVGHLGTSWLISDGLILSNNHDFVPNSLALLLEVLKLAHITNHEDVRNTLQRPHADLAIN